jgi:hypothetical protein
MSSFPLVVNKLTTIPEYPSSPRLDSTIKKQMLYRFLLHFKVSDNCFRWLFLVVRFVPVFIYGLLYHCFLPMSTTINICVTNDRVYVPLVVNTFRSFPRSLLITGFVTGGTRWVPLVEQKLLTLLKHLSSSPVFSGVHVAWSLVFCIVLYTFRLFTNINE